MYHLIIDISALILIVWYTVPMYSNVFLKYARGQNPKHLFVEYIHSDTITGTVVLKKVCYKDISGKEYRKLRRSTYFKADLWITIVITTLAPGAVYTVFYTILNDIDFGEKIAPMMTESRVMIFIFAFFLFAYGAVAYSSISTYFNEIFDEIENVKYKDIYKPILEKIV